MINQSTQSYGDLKTQLNFLNFPEEGECHPAWIKKLDIKLLMYLYVIYVSILNNINMYLSIDLDNKDENVV